MALLPFTKDVLLRKLTLGLELSTDMVGGSWSAGNDSLGVDACRAPGGGAGDAVSEGDDEAALSAAEIVAIVMAAPLAASPLSRIAPVCASELPNPRLLSLATTLGSGFF